VQNSIWFLFVRPIHKWGGDNIRRDFKGIGWMDVDWIYLVQDGYAYLAAVNTVMNVQVP
jgi:hypothetical protein